MGRDDFCSIHEEHRVENYVLVGGSAHFPPRTRTLQKHCGITAGVGGVPCDLPCSLPEHAAVQAGDALHHPRVLATGSATARPLSLHPASAPPTGCPPSGGPSTAPSATFVSAFATRPLVRRVAVTRDCVRLLHEVPALNDSACWGNQVGRFVFRMTTGRA